MFVTRLRTPVTSTYSVYRSLSNLKRRVYYAVGIGREVGVYESWKECESQIKGYPNARYQKFYSVEDAKEFVQYWKDFTKISNLEIESLKLNNSKDLSNKECLKNVLTIVSEMAHLKSDFKKIKEAINCNSNSWYSKRQKNGEEKTQNNSLGFVQLKKTEEPSEEPSRSYSTHNVAPIWKDKLDKLLECKKQIVGMEDARFKKFDELSEAKKYVDYWKNKTNSEEYLSTIRFDKTKDFKIQEKALNCLHLRLDDIEKLLKSMLKNSEEINCELSNVKSELAELKNEMRSMSEYIHKQECNTTPSTEREANEHFISPSRF